MKRKLLFILGLVLIFTFTACDLAVEPDPEPDPIPFFYDNRSLVTDECQDIENIGDWQPVWCEEFNYVGLPNEDKWTFEYGGYWYNNEVQFYTNKDEDNAYVDNGVLSITAIKEVYENRDYTSARLVSRYLGDFTYGRIQISAKLPSGKGTWPALWMMPTNSLYGGWPDSGEIDIMEYVGKDPNTVHGTLHSGAYNHSLGTHVGYIVDVPNAETEFHLYEIVWKPGIIHVYVDSKIYGTFEYSAEDNIDVSNSDAWPFDQDFYIIMNLALGGWGGTIDNSIFPQTMEVDYVRVFKVDYAGMDQENPSEVNNIILQKSTTNTLKIMWDKANDDIMIKEYLIFVNNVNVGTTSLNAFLIEGLQANTAYDISVVPVDFAGNLGEKVIEIFSTEE